MLYFVNAYTDCFLIKRNLNNKFRVKIYLRRLNYSSKTKYKRGFLYNVIVCTMYEEKSSYLIKVFYFHNEGNIGEYKHCTQVHTTNIIYMEMAIHHLGCTTTELDFYFSAKNEFCDL